MTFIQERGSLSTAPKTDPQFIKYSGGVVKRSGETGGIFKNTNEVPQSQKLFQASREFVHLKTPRDKVVYKFAMIGSLAALGLCTYGFWSIARPKKN